MQRRCEYCDFYTLKTSQCRRWPPFPAVVASIGADTIKGVWPEVNPHEWCGEFRPQRAAQPPVIGCCSAT